jgi:hypothetical protein
MNRDEEYFMVAVAFEASEASPAAYRVISRVADRHLSGEQRRTWMTIRLAESIFSGDSRASETVQLGATAKVKADRQRIERVVAKVARGLHYLDMGVAVDPSASVEVRINPSGLPASLEASAVYGIGQEFSYKWVPTKAGSVWYLRFYDTVSGLVRIGDAE